MVPKVASCSIRRMGISYLSMPFALTTPSHLHTHGLTTHGYHICFELFFRHFLKPSQNHFSLETLRGEKRRLRNDVIRIKPPVRLK